ncbi:hypothetical protein PPERSA_01304 [Pseudocohnilembus persalinus]|uniref:Uncharacterized protein n=1 Tax=Pseudocohnilembus persalinus TaxID=266149 RepID=A0A0V0QGR3_PSEPJ|nr:hypothetical protein PPERSA_01304 [Pseudocohnilembus persalinus]|eukprot:KRX01401.1 hypothetical protein PPERSA_01304 [Pseudocohnilembus persalinus]
MKDKQKNLIEFFLQIRENKDIQQNPYFQFANETSNQKDDDNQQNICQKINQLKNPNFDDNLQSLQEVLDQIQNQIIDEPYLVRRLQQTSEYDVIVIFFFTFNIYFQ